MKKVNFHRLTLIAIYVHEITQHQNVDIRWRDVRSVVGKMCHWNRFFLRALDFPLSLSFCQCC